MEHPLDPGIYFDLPANTYHSDPALGSTYIKRLAYSPEDYWHGSALNPHREPEEPTPAQVFGSAVHKLVLEGQQAFEASYAATDHSGSTKAGKAEREAITAAGKMALKREDWDRILVAGATIIGNPHVADAFTGGVSEVSVFWTDDDIRKKCRIDHVKLRASTDLKSIRPQRAVPFPANCRRAFSDLRYDVQALHYMDGRRAMADLVQAGAVHGDHDPAWLARVEPEAAFVFVFYRAEGAPQTWGTVISPEHPVLDIARVTIRQAEDNYRTYAAEFEAGAPWLMPAPLEELDINDLPKWHGAN